MRRKIYGIIILLCVSCSPSAKRSMEDVLGHPLQRDPAPYLTKAHTTIYTETGELKLLIPRNDVLYAKDYIELYLKERPNDIPALRVEADINRLLNKIEDSIGVYAKIIELNNKDPKSHFDLGNAYFEAQNFYKATLSYQEAINYSQEFKSEYYFALAKSYEKLDKIDRAKENFLITQEFDPLNEEAQKKATYFVALDELSQLMQSHKESFKECLKNTPDAKVLHSSVTTLPPNVHISIKETDVLDSKTKLCIDKIVEEFSYDYLHTVPIELEYALDLTKDESSNDKT